MNKMIKNFEKDGNNYGLEKYLNEYNEFVKKLKVRIDTLHAKFTNDRFFFDMDIYVEDWSNLLKDIFESQAYWIKNNLK